MAYIESHQAIGRHPKTLRLARRLGVSKHEAIGVIHMLWWWCLDYAPDGDLTGFGDDEIAMATEWPGEPAGLVDALVESRWLDRGADGQPLILLVHDWEEYGGKLVQRRRANAKRMRDARADTPDDAPPNHQLHPETHVQDTCAARAAGVQSEKREEKKSVEETRTTPPLPPGGDDGDGEPTEPEAKPTAVDRRFSRWWDRYPNKSAKIEALKAWRRLKPDDAMTERLIAAVDRQRTGDLWTREHGRYIPKPATWLNQGRWDDEVRASPGRASPGPAMTRTASGWDGVDDTPEGRQQFAAAWGLAGTEP